MARKLKTIEKQIEKKLVTGNNLAIDIGTLLREAREDHFTSEKGKVDGKALLAWGEESFSMKKAYIYRHINIATVFETEEMREAFAECSTAVLFKLTQSEEMLAAAVEAIESGDTIDGKWVSEYQEANKPAPSDDEGEEEEDEGSEGTGSSSGSDSVDDKYVIELEKQIEKLEAKIASMAEAAEASSNVDLTTHFESVATFMLNQTPAAVLGLEEGVTDKRKVNKAKRDVMKMYDTALVGDAGKPVLDVIQAAADSILGVTAEPEAEPEAEAESTPDVVVGTKKAKKAKKAKKEKA